MKMKLTKDLKGLSEEAYDYGTLTKHDIDLLLKNQKIVEHLEHRKKFPQAFNYAQFERWVTDILAGGNGFPRFTKDELEKIQGEEK